MATNTVKLFFDGIEYDCTGDVNKDKEFIFETVATDDKGAPLWFVKFPKHAILTEAIAAHNEANNVIPVKAEEEAQVDQEQLDQLAQLFG